MNQLFNSVYVANEANAKPEMLMMSLLVALLTGLWLAWVYKYKTLYTKDFVITLALLPTIIAMIIFLVNGNLGTSVAVAGTFSLIRFRSATSGSRELIAVFMAMIIGLASGTGYLLLAVLFTIFLLAVWLLLENRQSRTDNQRRRLLTINVPYQDLIDQKITKALLNFTSECDLISLNTTGGGETMQLVYEVDLNPQVDDFQLTKHLISNIENCDLALTKKAKKKKNL